MTIDCHSAIDLLGQKYISAIFCYDAYVFPHTLNFSITCSQTKVLFISQHYKPFVWIFMLTFTYINQTLLKTLFSSCKSTAGMTVIPALPKTVCFADGFKARRAQRGGFLMIKKITIPNLSFHHLPASRIFQNPSSSQFHAVCQDQSVFCPF